MAQQVLPGPVKNSFKGSERSPFGLLSFTSDPRTIRGGARSADGDARQIFPPMVAIRAFTPAGALYKPRLSFLINLFRRSSAAMANSLTAMPFDDIRNLLTRLPGGDGASAEAVRQRDAMLTKPPGKKMMITITASIPGLRWASARRTAERAG